MEKMTAKKSCKLCDYVLFEHLLFLLAFISGHVIFCLSFFGGGVCFLGEGCFSLCCCCLYYSHC